MIKIVSARYHSEDSRIYDQKRDSNSVVTFNEGEDVSSAGDVDSTRQTSSSCDLDRFSGSPHSASSHRRCQSVDDNHDVILEADHLVEVSPRLQGGRSTVRTPDCRAHISRSIHDENENSTTVPTENCSPNNECEARRDTVLRAPRFIYEERRVLDSSSKSREEIPLPPQIRREEVIKILKPEEINKNLYETTSRSYIPPKSDVLRQENQNYSTNQGKYNLLKKQLLHRHQLSLSKERPEKTAEEVRERENIPGEADEMFILSDTFNEYSSLHPHEITKELCDVADDVYSPEDSIFRCQVIVFLWILLGDRRILRAGYPSASVHLILWRVVSICCSVIGVKSPAAVPLPDSHNCGEDMLCFRDHVHRFLEVCAPTRDHWKQFGWASLTVDAVMNKIYKEELLHVLLKHIDAVPTPIRMAMRKVAHLEKAEQERKSGRGNPKPAWTSKQGSQSPDRNNAATLQFRPILPKPPEKRKRGRPVKIKAIVPDVGRIQRVMLWRFIMNLLEEPGNEDCIHWVKREEGIFRIRNTDWLARIWGRRHGNPRMTYEKMARAMRTYYRSKVLQPVPRARDLPRKLVYRFNPALIKKMPVNKERTTVL